MIQERKLQKHRNVRRIIVIFATKNIFLRKMLEDRQIFLTKIL